MTTTSAIGAAIVALGLGAFGQVSAGDWSQLIAAAGLTPAEAQGMTLTEIAAHKNNRETPVDAHVTVSTRSYPVFDVASHEQLVAVAGLGPNEARGMNLSEIAARKVNVAAATDERIPVAHHAPGSFDPASHAQLVAAAGLTADEAEGMTLQQVYVRKINREQRGDDRQGIVD